MGFLQRGSLLISAAVFWMATALLVWNWPQAAVTPKPLGEIRLIAHDGGVVTNGSVSGNPYLVHFGYTRCPDVCPMALAQLSGVLSSLASEGIEFPVFFVTVDPEHDRPNSQRSWFALVLPGT